MSKKETEVETKVQPVKKFKAGGVTVSVWVNTSDKGTFSSYNLQRTYQDKDGEWQHTSNLKLNDLQKAIVCLQKAFEWEVLQEQDAVKDE